MTVPDKGDEEDSKEEWVGNDESDEEGSATTVVSMASYGKGDTSRKNVQSPPKSQADVAKMGGHVGVEEGSRDDRHSRSQPGTTPPDKESEGDEGEGDERATMMISFSQVELNEDGWGKMACLPLYSILWGGEWKRTCDGLGWSEIEQERLTTRHGCRRRVVESCKLVSFSRTDCDQSSSKGTCTPHTPSRTHVAKDWRRCVHEKG